MTMSITKGHTRFIPCSLHSDCKNVQKSALKSVNVQRTGKSILQMFAFSFFEGSHICRFLPILRPSTVPRSHFSYPKTKAFTLIISHLYLQIVTSASESNRNENRERSAFPIFLSLVIGVNRHAVFGRVSLPHLTFLATEDQHQRKYY